MQFYLLLLLAIPVLLALFVAVRQVTVFEYERGLRYRHGRFTGVVEPGAYWVWPRRTTIVRVDVRPVYMVVPGQEVVTADGVGLKMSVSAKYQVSDPERAINSVASYQTALYTLLQLALREIVAGNPIDYVLEKREAVNRGLYERCAAATQEFGITLLEAAVKDIMFPGELKKVFAQVVKARQEGLAALERARGETAALRNLANAAALLEQRPSLLHLRLLQSIGQASGNTVVLGMGGQPQTIPLRQPLPDSTPGELPTSGESQE
jgi:regulator of protease activity HflC (stomatin/prohibitin superfamily)